MDPERGMRWMLNCSCQHNQCKGSGFGQPDLPGLFYLSIRRILSILLIDAFIYMRSRNSVYLHIWLFCQYMRLVGQKHPPHASHAILSTKMSISFTVEMSGWSFTATDWFFFQYGVLDNLLHEECGFIGFGCNLAFGRFKYFSVNLLRKAFGRIACLLMTINYLSLFYSNYATHQFLLICSPQVGGCLCSQIWLQHGIEGFPLFVKVLVLLCFASFTVGVTLAVLNQAQSTRDWLGFSKCSFFTDSLGVLFISSG